MECTRHTKFSLSHTSLATRTTGASKQEPRMQLWSFKAGHARSLRTLWSSCVASPLLAFALWASMHAQADLASTDFIILHCWIGRLLWVWLVLA